MKTVSVEIVGTGRGYLQHRRNIEKDFAEQVTTKRKSRSPSTLAEFKTEALDGLYVDEKGKPYMPSTHIERALVDAGKAFQIRGQGKKTYKSDMMASIIISPPCITIRPPEWETDIQAVKIQGKQTFRARPLFKPGWSVKFNIEIQNPDLMPETVKDILDYAGKHVGIGDYRPRYGQFEIKEFK